MKIQKHAVPRFTGLRPSSPLASALKRRTLRRNTAPEMLVRRALWARGLRYRVDDRALAGRPDLAFLRARVVVFCDGDFWHGRQWGVRREKLRMGSNPEYWLAKIESNRRRDRLTTRVLRGQGWLVLRFWETDILQDLDEICTIIVDAVRAGTARRAAARS